MANSSDYIICIVFWWYLKVNQIDPYYVNIALTVFTFTMNVVLQKICFPKAKGNPTQFLYTPRHSQSMKLGKA